MTPKEVSSGYDTSIIVRRWVACWVDLILFGGILFGLALAYDDNIPGPFIVAWLVAIPLYYVVLEGLTGKTLGKLIACIKVVDEQGRPPGLWKGLVRTLPRLIEVNPLFLGGVPAGIVVLVSKTRQRLGDMMAGTYVLKTKDLPAAGG